jgi:mycothione reductase
MVKKPGNHFDFVVVGTGCGSIVASEAAEHGMKVCVIDKGPLLGGTCLNLGCIPSKKLIYAADRVMDIKESGKLGINASVKNIDFPAIMQRMRKSREESEKELHDGLKNIEHVTFLEGTAHFIDARTIEINNKKITGKKIVLATGSRPFIPPIKNLDKVKYLTSESALELKKLPASLIIIGGGYIAVEYGHFFDAMGSKVTMIEMTDRLVSAEEPEIAELLRKELGKRIDIFTGKLVQEVKKTAAGITVFAKDRKTGKTREYNAAAIMIAGGRQSNADLLDPSKAGIELDQRGFFKVNEYLQTNVPHIFAVGDANGMQMFTHMANMQASALAENLVHKAKLKIDFSFTPHAVFSRPQIASVGLREADAKAKYRDAGVGIAAYGEVARGDAMMEETGFAKLITEPESGQILGCHIIGPEAAELIQEVINAMDSKTGIAEILNGIHIHPALSELVQAATDKIASA